MAFWYSVLVPTPAHSSMAVPLTYTSELSLASGALVRVPLGQRETVGIIWQVHDKVPANSPKVEKIRAIASVLTAVAPMGQAWCTLLQFAASYYQRALGEMALAALPPQMRELSDAQLLRKQTRRLAVKPRPAQSTPVGPSDFQPFAAPTHPLSTEQAQALTDIASHGGPFLLFGSTGSGKTEVYLRCVADLLLAEPRAQVLVMVPEINLTPQLQDRFCERFAPQWGSAAVVAMHSGMTPAQRLSSWLAAHEGSARIILGTRMAVLASMPQLRLIVVDEEHDPSYKSQEGARYSARDLAVYLGKQIGAKVILGSATPSLESWHHSRPAAEGAAGRYQRLNMPSRIAAVRPFEFSDASNGLPDASAIARGAGETSSAADPGSIPWPALPTSPALSTLPASSTLPVVRRVDMGLQPKKTVLSPPLLAAMALRIERGEQCLVLLNRRGYAPVLQCTDCEWKSDCPNCSAYRVFHKVDRSLRCHHCGLASAVPRGCPTCGNPDIAPVGRGTERLQENLTELLASLRQAGSVTEHTPEGLPVRIARIDADSTRLKGELEVQLGAVHAGEVDVLVGTQMIAKGHDFRRVTLVAAINPDGALYSSDFRAAERLFSLLMQATGRAGRDAVLGSTSEMWIQTSHPRHPLFEALRRHDFPAFAHAQLEERRQASLPPFSFQALLRADARTQDVAQAFLTAAREAACSQLADLPGFDHVTLYPAVPMSMQRVANIERAQLLVESTSRQALQRMLTAWQPVLQATRSLPQCKGLVRWAVDVDPLLI